MPATLSVSVVELPDVVVLSMREAMETSWWDVVLSEDVDMAEEEVSFLEEEEVDLPEEEDDVQVGGVDEVSRQANVDDRLRSSEFVDEKLGMSGIGGGRGGAGGGAMEVLASILELSLS